MISNSSIKHIALAIAFILGSIGFIRTSITVVQSRHRLELLRQEVANLEQQKSHLKVELDYQKTPEYIEMEARNKLNLIKPGDKLYIVDEKLAQDINKGIVLSQSTSKSDLSDRKQNLYNWLNLLF